jgi:hypothetical protein
MQQLWFWLYIFFACVKLAPVIHLGSSYLQAEELTSNYQASLASPLDSGFPQSSLFFIEINYAYTTFVI